MSWFEKSVEKKAEECGSCKILYDKGEYAVCENCGHLCCVCGFCTCEEIKKGENKNE